MKTDTFQPDIQVATELWDSMSPNLKAKSLTIHGSRNVVITKLADALIKHIDIALNDNRLTHSPTR
jgi:hypothetical protein